MHIVIIGAHGKIGLRLLRLLTPSHSVAGIVRDGEQALAISEAKGTPLVLSLETTTVQNYTSAFETAQAQVIYFLAGASGRGGDDRYRTVDYEGAVKVFDAVEGMKGEKPRVIMLSALDVRKIDDSFPAHYNDEDKMISGMIRQAHLPYVKWKYEAEKDLAKRTTFKWTMLRPGYLVDEDGVGNVSIGKTHLGPKIPRDDAARVFALLLAREDASGLSFDLAGGDTPLEQALDDAIAKGESDFMG